TLQAGSLAQRALPALPQTRTRSGTVKRIMLLVTAAAAAGAVYVGSRLGAQPATAPEAPPVTRVAFVNVAKVFQDYEKAKFYKTEMEKFIEPKKALHDKLAKEIIGWKAAVQDSKFDPREKERYERGIRDNQRQLEDLDRDMRQALGEKNEQQYVQLYKE